MSFVRYSLGALVLLAGSAKGQVLDPRMKITFSCSAQRAVDVLPKLSKIAGVTLAPNPQTGSEVLLIQVKDVPVLELMAKIADVCHAEWRRDRKAFRLIRRTGILNKAKEEETKYKLGRYKAVLDHAFLAQTKVPIWSDSEASLLANSIESMPEVNPVKLSQLKHQELVTSGYRQRTPAARAIVSLLSKIGIDKLASLEEDKRTVFALHPNPLQLSLPAGVDSIFRTFVKEDAQYASKFTNRFARGLTLAEALSGGVPSLVTPGISMEIGQATVAVRRFEGAHRGWNIELAVLNPSGEIIGAAQQEISQDGWAPIYPVSKDSSPRILIGSDGIELERECRQSVVLGQFIDDDAGKNDLLNGRFPSMSSEFAAQSGELRNVLLNPEKSEPLAIFEGPAISQAGRWLHANIIADIPDTSFLRVMSAFEAPTHRVTVNQFLNQVCPQAAIKVRQPAGWLLLSASEPIRSIERRVNRVALGQFLRSNASSNGLTLTSLTNFALSQDKQVRVNDIDGVLIALANPKTSYRSLSALKQRDLLRIIGPLSGDSPNSPLTLATPIQAKPEEIIEVLLNSGVLTHRGMDFDQGKLPPGTSGNALRREITLAFPGGFDTKLTMDVSRSISEAISASSFSSGSLTILSMAELAQNIYSGEGFTYRKLHHYALFQTVRDTVFEVRIHIGEFATLHCTLEDVSPTQDSLMVRFEHLPKAILEDIHKRVEALRGHPSLPKPR